MLWSRFAYSLLFASLVLACARPSVEDDVLDDQGVRDLGDAGPRDGDDEDGEDGDDQAPTAQRDAGGAGRDAGSPAREQDAGSRPAPCPDRDNDQVCDPDDNCVAASNRSQDDSDDDGIGDACDEVVLATCNGEPDPLEEELDLRLARVRTVRINGSDGRASVKPGAMVTVSAELTLVSVASCFPPQRPVSVGVFEGGDQKCEQTVLCNMFQPVTETVAFEIDAPREPGWHYVGMSIGTVPIGQTTAPGCQGETQLEVKIAALCVEP